MRTFDCKLKTLKTIRSEQAVITGLGLISLLGFAVLFVWNLFFFHVEGSHIVIGVFGGSILVACVGYWTFFKEASPSSYWISDDNAAELIVLCNEYPELDAYRKKVLMMNRKFTRHEYWEMKKWPELLKQEAVGL